MSSRLTFYPSLKAQMGIWDYYITRMTMSDVIREVKFASEFGAQQNQVDLLSKARQRELVESRVRGPIIKFLAQDYRFFSSIVIAAIGGKPMFFPVSVAADSAGNVMAGSGIDESFGVLRMEGSVDMYALDGQHRLSAIKCMLDESYREKMQVKEDIKVPPGFAEEHITVIMIIRKKDDNPKDFLVGYRRLFSNLNRYAKKTDGITNIIMDEDDTYAILTRRLISQHSFFKDTTKKKEAESTKVKMRGSPSMSSGDPEFIPLEFLYKTTKALLGKGLSLTARLEEDKLDKLYKDLSDYWDAILKVLPDLKKEPLKMRPSAGKGHLFFRPIGQKMMAELVHDLLNLKFPNKRPTVAEMEKCLAVLTRINWNVDSPPWARVVTVSDGKGGYTMRDEKRDKPMKVAKDIALRMAGDKNMDIDILFEQWKKIVELDLKEAEKKWKKDVLPLLG